MYNLLRTLVFDDQVSLTIADTTELVQEGQHLHGLKKGGAKVLGKFLSAAAFMSAALKEDSGEISFALQGNGIGGPVNVSGNRALRVRGYLENAEADGSEQDILGNFGSFTVIRDDGYSRPFVGSCGYPEVVSVDGLIEEYYRISEQLPTFVASVVDLDDNGLVSFAGIIVLQPLPFTDEKVIEQLPKGENLEKIVRLIQTQGIENVAIGSFLAKKDGIERRAVTYTCNCSREYLMQVLTSVGEEQMRAIIREDGALRVHCHYCNTDYVFMDGDVDEIFHKTE